MMVPTMINIIIKATIVKVNCMSFHLLILNDSKRDISLNENICPPIK